MKNFVQSIYSW